MPKKRLALLVGFVFIDVLGYSLFFPLLPYYAAIFGASPTLVGWMIAANAAAQFVASPLVGRLSDRFGRRPTLIASIVGTLASFLLLGLAEPIGASLAGLLSSVRIGNLGATTPEGGTVAVLFFCRILDGLAGGNVSLARTYISDITDDQNRAKGLGMIGAAFGFGFVIGPAIGGTLSNWKAAAGLFRTVELSRFAVPAFVAVLVSGLNLLGVIIWLPESLPRERRAAPAPNGRSMTGLGNLRLALQQPRFAPMLLVRFLLSLALTLFMANFALYTRYRIGLTDQITSYVMTYAGILLILVQAVGVGWMTKRFSERQITIGGLVLITAAFLGLAVAPNLIPLLVVLFPLALSGGTLNTVINSMISKSVRSDEVGAALGLATSAESLTWVLAPSIGGFLIEYLGGWSLGLLGGAITGLLIAYTRQHLAAQPEPALPRHLNQELEAETDRLERTEDKEP
jgi:DHA1 family tetracycline resistance protein-like MFS transporter